VPACHKEEEMPNWAPGPARAIRFICAAAILAGCCVLAAGAGRPGPLDASQGQLLQPSSPIPPLVLDAVVVDRKGAPVSDMRASDFQVLLDGKPRVGVAIARMFRGPGAMGLVAARLATSPGEMPPLAEPSRIVVFVADQGSFLPGDERRARLVVENCLGLVGLGDRVMFITLPDLAGSQTLSADRDPLRQGLGRILAMRWSYSASTGAPAADVPRPKDPFERADERVAGAPDRAAESARGTPVRPDALAKLDDLLPGAASAGTETISPPANRAHAVAMLDSLRQVLQGLRKVPGAKTVFLFSAGLVADQAGTEMTAALAEAAGSFSRIYAIQVPTPAQRFSEMGRIGLVNLARNTGGTLVTLTDKPAQALQRMVAELSFSYLLMLSPQPGDLEATSRTVLVRTRRKDVIIRTGTAIVPGRLLPERVAAPPGGAVPPAGGKPAPSGETSARRIRHDPAVDAVLARVADYVVNYGREFSAIVAEEVYEQEVTRSANVGSVAAAQQPSARRLVSDYLLVKVPGAEGWAPFRDVFEVDGVKVRDRDDRLKKLFLEAPPEKAIENANKIWLESARYNIGAVWRNINVPTLPLMVVSRGTLEKFQFTKRREPTESGIRAWEIDYLEIARPTIIKTRTEEDVVMSGTLWVDPVSGRILRTRLKASGATITVTYQPQQETAGLWLPVIMKESYEYPTARIRATATYSKFRRFQVFTQEDFKPPKRP
jgi:hypothetical protein